MLPIITISRQACSGGEALCRLLSDKLNIEYLDKELITLAAKESGVSEEYFAKADEIATDSFLYSMVMGQFSFSGTGLPIDTPVNDKLFIAQNKIINKRADEGPCIILGRCGNYILKDRSNILKIFIYAKKEDRMKIAVQRGLCTSDKAFDYITKMDKRRANYYNFYCNENWDDMSNYDLVINTSTFSVEQIANIVVSSVQD